MLNGDEIVSYKDLSENIRALIIRICDVGGERGEQICGLNIVSSLSKFVYEGKWYVGLIDESGYILTNPVLWPEPSTDDGIISWQSSTSNVYEPIIWFGLDNEAPIDCWTLSRNHNYLSALSDGKF